MKRLVSTVGLPKAEWLKYRKQGICGSDAGAIAGMNPYVSAFSVYQDKIADAIKDEQVKVKATEDSFLKLKEQIDLSLTQINTIAGDVEVLNSAKDEANSAVQDLSAISEENAASNEEVTASVSSLAGNISDIAGRSDGLERMSEVLQDAIKVFK